jgi:hypothetical protein
LTLARMASLNGCPSTVIGVSSTFFSSPPRWKAPAPAGPSRSTRGRPATRSSAASVAGEGATAAGAPPGGGAVRTMHAPTTSANPSEANGPREMPKIPPPRALSFDMRGRLTGSLAAGKTARQREFRDCRAVPTGGVLA